MESDEYASAVSTYIKEVVASAVKAERERVVGLISDALKDANNQLSDKLLDLVRDGN